MTSSDMINRDSVCEKIKSRVVIAVIRAPSAASAIRAAEALATGGITAIEIACTTPDAPKAIAALSRQDNGLVIGAGTVMNGNQATALLDAGAVFLVSPCVADEVLAIGEAHGVLAIPGVFTPSEVAAVADRALLLKLFPASVGGLALLVALRAPFPQVRFIPSGGVNAENIQEWLSAGAYAVSAGSDLCPPAALANGDFAAIERQARRYAQAAAHSNNAKWGSAADTGAG